MPLLSFPKLSPALRKLFLTLHVGVSVSWLGACGAMLILSLIGMLTEDVELRHAAYAFMHIFDLALVIPLVVLSISSGLLVSLGTPWGLFQYWWVVIKLLISLGIVGFATVQENFWVRGLAEQTAQNRAAALGSVPLNLSVCMVAFFAALWIATVLSIYKPWGRTQWGEVQYLKRKEKAR
ncbi:MAG: hypothetical protein DYG89_47050 [Caldilinea sp. CFX5]|nr:hypothetical protein [Caldilinea sp. CFX5]